MSSFLLSRSFKNIYMITIYLSNVNSIDAETYTKITDNLNLHSLTCSKCHKHDFVRHGYYVRTLKFRNSSIKLRILRVRCLSCGATHAILLYFIVPYSQYSLEIHLKAISSRHIDDFLEWIEWNSTLAEYSFYYIRWQYRTYWKERIFSENISFDSSLVHRCFKIFSLQFMQIKCTRNFLSTPVHIS